MEVLVEDCLQALRGGSFLHGVVGKFLHGVVGPFSAEERGLLLLGGAAAGSSRDRQRRGSVRLKRVFPPPVDSPEGSPLAKRSKSSPGVASLSRQHCASSKVVRVVLLLLLRRLESGSRGSAQIIA